MSSLSVPLGQLEHGDYAFFGLARREPFHYGRWVGQAMTGMKHDGQVRTVEDLEALYGAVAPPSVIKEVDHIQPVYRPFIEAAPFAVLATAGPNGLDARGPVRGWVQDGISRA